MLWVICLAPGNDHGPFDGIMSLFQQTRQKQQILSGDAPGAVFFWILLGVVKQYPRRPGRVGSLHDVCRHAL